MIAFEIEGAGEHTVEMKYAPKTFTLGLAISLLSLMLFIIIVVFEKPLMIIRDKLIARASSSEDADSDCTINEDEKEEVTTETQNEMTED